MQGDGSTRFTTAPRVSVVTTAFGDLSYLDETVDSILRQDYRGFEYIIVDDASARPDLFERLAQRDPRIRILRNQINLGAAGAANRAIELASGEIIVRIDADDIAEPARLSRLVAAFHADPGLGLVGSWFVRIGPDGRELETVRTPTSDVELRWRLLFHNPFCHSTVAFRRSVFDRAAGYNETMRASLDADLWYRMAPLCRIGCVGEVLARYRIHPNGITARNPPDWRLRTEHHRRRLWDDLGVPYQSDILPDLVQFVEGWDISRIERRRQVYTTLLALLRAFAAPGRAQSQDEGYAQVDRLKHGLVKRILADRTMDLAAWCALCRRARPLDRRAADQAAAERLRGAASAALRAAAEMLGRVRRRLLPSSSDR